MTVRDHPVFLSFSALGFGSYPLKQHRYYLLLVKRILLKIPIGYNFHLQISLPNLFQFLDYHFEISNEPQLIH